MTKGILGKKVGMTQIFTEAGELIPVTVVEATPNVVLQVKTVETDGYNAVQVGFDDLRDVLSNKPAKGHVAKANTAPKRFIREFKNIEGLEVGAEIAVDTFEAGDVVVQWLTVLVITVVLVLWDQLRLTVFSKTNTWQDAWVAIV